MRKVLNWAIALLGLSLVDIVFEWLIPEDSAIAPTLVVLLLTLFGVYVGVQYRRHWRFDVSQSVNRDKPDKAS